MGVGKRSNIVSGMLARLLGSRMAMRKRANGRRCQAWTWRRV
jgi:hypothetical protein